MVQFDKLRLSGFKSFVDPTELAIEPGMTGIVGPNGCGKSNLVEALKWVMGETSAKQMRGSEMEDVIFAGAGTAAGAQHRRGDAVARQQDAHGAGDGERHRPARRHAPHRAWPRLGLFGERPRDPRPRRADAVRRRRDRLALHGAGQPGPHRHADQRQAGRPPHRDRRGRRHHRSLRPPSRGRAAPACRRAEPGARAGRAGRARRTAQGAEAPGPPGQPLPQPLRPYPPRGSRRAGAEAGDRRARSGRFGRSG